MEHVARDSIENRKLYLNIQPYKSNLLETKDF